MYGGIVGVTLVCAEVTFENMARQSVSRQKKIPDCPKLLLINFRCIPASIVKIYLFIPKPTRAICLALEQPFHVVAFAQRLRCRFTAASGILKQLQCNNHLAMPYLCVRLHKIKSGLSIIAGNEQLITEN
ncbi:MAG: hypothetical protein LBJ00_05660 [Planctomycetaceae bacterium]|nr:hypothetical protein [Planctomycetaceae bacterium]